MNEEVVLQEAMRRLDEEDAAAPQASTTTGEDPSQVNPDRPSSTGFRGVWDSVGAGMAKAGIETKDFVFGEPEEHEKSEFRKGVEGRAKELSSASTVNSVTMGVSQIVTGLVGAGKLLGPIKAVQKLKGAGKAGRTAYEVSLGGTVGAVVVDPHEERLSNLIEDFPQLQNPVTEFLAASPDDTAAQGRLKNALEGIGIDAGLLIAIKAIKFLKSGDQEAAKREIAKLNRNAKEFGLDFGEGAQAGVAKEMPGATPANVNEFGLEFGEGAQAGVVKETMGGGPSRSHIAVEVEGELVAEGLWSWNNNGLLSVLAGFPGGEGRVFRTTPPVAGGRQTGTSPYDWELVNQESDRLLYIQQEALDREGGWESRITDAEQSVSSIWEAAQAALDAASLAEQQVGNAAIQVGLAADQVVLAANQVEEAEGVLRETEAARDAALAAAGSLTFARLNAEGDLEFVLGAVVVAKLTTSGDFLTQGDIGINQTI